MDKLIINKLIVDNLTVSEMTVEKLSVYRQDQSFFLPILLLDDWEDRIFDSEKCFEGVSE